MVPFSQLQIGYYGSLAGNNPARGIFAWGGDGRGCNHAGMGWFVVDDVSYTAGSLSSVDLRFEQHCEGASPALHGKVHWRFDDSTQAPGPVTPVPSGLWAPPTGATPAFGNFFYVQSEVGDVFGVGTRLFTPSNATLQAASLAREFSASAQNSTSAWNAHFDPMNSIPKLQAGYYPNVQRSLLHNPTLGGMSVDGEGRACNEISGWFAIDSISYSGDQISSIDVRFEQHCDGAAGALHGRIRWSQ
jgi:hypothetical protein